jgi:holo-[acyl-carrier protein] synthase
MVFVIDWAAVADLSPPEDRRWGERLTEAELSYCFGLSRVGEHLAARALAKCSVARALAWQEEVPWDDIEIVRSPSGRPTVRLTGRLEGWRRGHGLPRPGVSLSHAAGHAAAAVWLAVPEARDQEAVARQVTRL